MQKLAEAILYPLWDAKVDAGHAVRAYDQALALPARRFGGGDRAARRAIHGWGTRSWPDKFLDAFRARVAKTAAEDFVARLRAEQKARHSRFGDTIFLLEPDLKNGPGGMRDLCVGRWAAAARFGTVRSHAAPGAGGDDGPARPGVHGGDANGCCASASPCTRRRGAGRTTCASRCRRRWRRCSAPRRGSRGVIRPAVHPAVEALMHQYHAHAKLMRNETERLLQRATAPTGDPPPHPAGSGALPAPGAPRPELRGPRRGAGAARSPRFRAQARRR